MKKFLIICVLLASSVTFATQQPISCSQGDGDAFRNISIYEDGSVSITYYEAHFYFQADQVSISKSDSEYIPAELYQASRQKINVQVEGNEEIVKNANFSFSYNPKQKAGRLTFIYDGYAGSRNELYTNCNDQVLGK